MAALALGITLVAACGHARSPADSVALDPQAAESVLNIDNRNWRNVDVFAEHDGIRTRLGTVPGSSTARFPLRAFVLRAWSLRFVARAIGDKTSVTTDQILLQSGQELDWQLETDLDRSMLSIRPVADIISP